MGIEFKVCTKCKRELELSSFHNNKSTKDGLSYWCKECNRKQNTRYSQEHKEELKQNKIAWNERHKGNYIYFIYDINNQKYPLYCGSSSMLRRRVSNHMNGYVKPTKDYIEANDVIFKYYNIEEDIDRKSLYYIEEIIINELDMPLNTYNSNIKIDDIELEEKLSNIAYELIDHLDDLLIEYE